MRFLMEAGAGFPAGAPVGRETRLGGSGTFFGGGLPGRDRAAMEGAQTGTSSEVGMVPAHRDKAAMNRAQLSAQFSGPPRVYVILENALKPTPPSPRVCPHHHGSQQHSDQQPGKVAAAEILIKPVALPVHQRQRIAHCDLHLFPPHTSFIAQLARRDGDLRFGANLRQRAELTAASSI